MTAKRSGVGPTVVLVGRPNVGKSTLFNRITATRRAIVTPMPGTTRDVIAQPAEWLGTKFTLVDTGGLFGASADPLHEMVVEHGRRAIQSADVLIFVVDGREGVVSGDEEIAQTLRPVGVPVMMAVNKTDDKRARSEEFHRLGIAPVVEIAAEHGHGIGDLLDEVLTLLGADTTTASRARKKAMPKLMARQTPTQVAGTKTAAGTKGKDDAESATEPGVRAAAPAAGAGGEEDPDDHYRHPSDFKASDDEISVAIVGRPNVGKSSMVNRLLREERVMVSDMPGTTRDPIDTLLRWHNRDLRIVDTAGIRRAGKVASAQQVEAVSVVLARRAILRADVAVLLIDSVEGPTDQDAAIAGEAERAGCGVIIVANKWDLMKGRGEDFSIGFDDELRRRLRFLDYAPVLHISALTGERTPKLLEAIERIAEARRKRVTTGELNRFLEKVTAANPPVSPGQHRVRIMYASQTAVAPPTFVLFTNIATTFHFSYERFLVNQLRETFGFEGSPIRLHIRRRRSTSKSERLASKSKSK
jgi:GTP-binding protein